MKYLNKLLIAVFTLTSIGILAQNSYTGAYNPITTTVPFLTISPDARGGSIADMGVASEPDAFSMHYNPAKYAYTKNKIGVGVAYSPWLASIAKDIDLAYLSGYARIDKNQVIAASLRYFNLGNIAFTDEYNYSIGNYVPHEFAIDVTYSRMLTATLSGGISARFIHSNLTLGQSIGSQTTKPGNSVAADVSVYQRLPIMISNYEGYFAWGVNISNIGSKISYTDDNTEKEFIPANLRIGPALHIDFDDYNKATFMLEINKLLVPTPRRMGNDSTLLGLDDNVSVPVGIIHSFYDAPGGFKEELQEYNVAAGVEYWYANQFALRGGFFYENKNKGGRSFATLGAGFKYNVIGIDVSYIIPVVNYTTNSKHPLANTMRFSLSFDIN
ncbi:MAG: type IX secretion system outer membrane channel protein PorV [Bacteroidales bacterium]